MTVEWLTPAQAAPLMGLAPQTVRAMCAARQIEHLNISRGSRKARYRISSDAIRAWQRTRTVTALQGGR